MATGSSDDDIALASAPALRISTAASSSDAATSLLIGIYKKLKKPGRFDEPAFENARTAMFLYQQSPGTWCMGRSFAGTERVRVCATNSTCGVRGIYQCEPLRRTLCA